MRPALAATVVCFFALFPSDAQITLNPTPTRVVGQNSLALTNVNPNLVEGREFYAPQGVALDLSTNPPGIYVADTGNNRVLGFRSATTFSNGQKADIVLGQPDFVTTLPQGPAHARSTGFTAPTGVAVDGAGNLYVVDAGNNRILRFPKPFSQSGDQLPDLVIGQSSFSTNTANQGGISAATLATTAGSTALQSFLTFDSSGNLWATDPGNNRILRYNVSALGAQATPGPSADVVLGQQDFVTGTYAPVGNAQISLAAIRTPSGITFDAGGRLFVGESVGSQRGRILVWNPPFSTAQRASRILGVDLDTPQPPAISSLQLNAAIGGLFSVGNQIGVADTFNNRLLLYPPFDQWSSNALNQAAATVIGQADFLSGTANQGQPGAGPSTLAHPLMAAYSGSELYVADSGNHRVIVMPASGSAFGAATRVLGQDALDLNALNLIEGREFDFVGSASIDAGIAVDLNANPPHLYVADTYNNRILGFRDLRNLQPGAKADIVIGQPDFRHNFANYPSNSGNTPNQSGLFGPAGLLVDSDGNLYVADSGNGRVLRFPQPFANYNPGTMEQADLVLGQPNFFITLADPTSRTMARPFGLAMTTFPGLLVSDAVHNRVLFFQGSSKTFTSGQAASLVFGQPDFNSSSPGNGLNQLNAPHHIATDADDRLYVADTGNQRVSIFDHAPSSSPNPQAAVILKTGLSGPVGIHVSPVSNAIWVANTGNNTAVRYPAFNGLELNNYAPNATLNEYGPRALAEDAWGNIFIADAANRVVIHYPGLSSLNAANYEYANVVAPGMIAALYSTGNLHQFGTNSETSSSLPLPRQLNGVQVLFNGSPVPLFYAGPDQINYQIPIGAPQSGTSDVQVVEVATGRLLGDSTVQMNAVLPGIFTQAGNGSGAAIAVNEDGTLNTQSNPAIAGHFITLYGTGQGFVDGAPPDGDVSHAPLPTPRAPTVFITPDPAITGSDVQYAGLAPGQVGVWQINVKIPGDIITLPNNPTYVVVFQNSVPSSDIRLGRQVQIYVRQPK
ncbi:MAG TPA: hypothetical protein VHB50_23190 [Bryobacteraceae bacterium]|nr:hypothetical protein [Bryobacteraceae bacterium]